VTRVALHTQVSAAREGSNQNEESISTEQRSRSEVTRMFASTRSAVGYFKVERKASPTPEKRAQSFLSDDIGQRFGGRLRELRRIHQLTQLDLAVVLGIDRCYLSAVECGKKGVSLATLEIIAIGFQLKLSDLLSDL
jgi:DNA-binding XRE family transcriptional regulator